MDLFSQDELLLRFPRAYFGIGKTQSTIEY